MELESSAPKSEEIEVFSGLSEDDLAIVEVIALAVRGQGIPQRLRRVWRQSYNQIAIVLRHQMAQAGEDYHESDQVDKFVTSWVVGQRA